jgi:hypothetical protein
MNNLLITFLKEYFHWLTAIQQNHCKSFEVLRGKTLQMLLPSQNLERFFTAQELLYTMYVAHCKDEVAILATNPIHSSYCVRYTLSCVYYIRFYFHATKLSRFADLQPSAKLYTCENLDQALAQRHNMSVQEYWNQRSLKAKICES